MRMARLSLHCWHGAGSQSVYANDHDHKLGPNGKKQNPPKKTTKNPRGSAHGAQYCVVLQGRKPEKARQGRDGYFLRVTPQQVFFGPRAHAESIASLRGHASNVWSMHMVGSSLGSGLRGVPAMLSIVACCGGSVKLT